MLLTNCGCARCACARAAGKAIPMELRDEEALRAGDTPRRTRTGTTSTRWRACATPNCSSCVARPLVTPDAVHEGDEADAAQLGAHQPRQLRHQEHCGRLSRRCPARRPPPALRQHDHATARLQHPAHALPAQGRQQGVLFANQSDFIAFRHHMYRSGSGGSGGGETEGGGAAVRHAAVPIKLGTVDISEADSEWVLRPCLNTAKMRNTFST